MTIFYLFIYFFTSFSTHVLRGFM